MPSENREYFQNVVMSAAKTQVTHTIFHFHLHHQSVFLSGLPARVFLDGGPFLDLGVLQWSKLAHSRKTQVETKHDPPIEYVQENPTKNCYVVCLRRHSNVGRYIFLWLKPTAVPRGGRSSCGYSLLQACSFAREEAIFSCGPLYTST